jgi:hypothetical protein
VNWLHERRTDEGSREIAALIVTLTNKRADKHFP